MAENSRLAWRTAASIGRVSKWTTTALSAKTPSATAAGLRMRGDAKTNRCPAVLNRCCGVRSWIVRWRSSAKSRPGSSPSRCPSHTLFVLASTRAGCPPATTISSRSDSAPVAVTSRCNSPDRETLSAA